jgi:predicted porin
MNKKFLVAAIAAGLMVPGMASADVKIFGVVQAETGEVDIDVSGAAGDHDTVRMGNATNGAIHGGGVNQLGVKGDEKLGNGLTAYFKFNNEFSTFDRNGNNRVNGAGTQAGTGGWNSRDVFVGIKGDGWHTQFGTMNSLYKTSSHAYDPFHGTGAQARAQQHSSGLQNGYIDNAMEVGFKSGGWDGGIQITWEDASKNTDSAGGGFNGDNVDAGSWNGSIKYKANGWEASFAYLDVDYGGSQGNLDAWKVAGKYSANGFTVAAQYEDLNTSSKVVTPTRPDGTSNGMVGFSPQKLAYGDADFDTFAVFATYKISDSTTLMGRYGIGDFEEGNGSLEEVDHDGWAIGVKHNMSKRTYVYGGYMQNDYDYDVAADTDVDAWVAGLIHKF